MITLLALYSGILLDALLGEPRRYHPLVGFGGLVEGVEGWLNRGANRYFWGVVALLLLLLPIVVIGYAIEQLVAQNLVLAVIVSALLLYLSIGMRSLFEHGDQVAEALNQHDLPLARERVGWMVSRDTSEMDESAVTRSVLESMLENGADALFGALFWFLVAGIPGVLAYRAVNTLDAMWGYRTDRFRQFGWAAARLDDLMNVIPARLTALSYALVGATRAGWRCWREQAWQCDSPNGGPVMAAGAGALRVKLGGDACYHGVWKSRPQLGCGNVPMAQDILRTKVLIVRALALWVMAATMMALLIKPLVSASL